MFSGVSVHTNTAVSVASAAACKIAFGKSAALGQVRVAAVSPRTSRTTINCDTVAGKMKTRKAAAKRYKVTASGKVRIIARFHARVHTLPWLDHLDERARDCTVPVF